MENIITTNRLVLAPMNENDIDFIFVLEKQYESYQYDADNAPTYDEVVKRCNGFIQKMQKLPDDGAIRWIVRKDRVTIG